MVIFGQTPREWMRKVMSHKKLILVAVVAFIVGGIII